MIPRSPLNNDPDENEAELEMEELIDRLDSQIVGLKGKLDVLEADFTALISFFRATPDQNVEDEETN